MQIAEVKERAEKICDNMEQVIVGKRMQIKYVLAAFLAGGNVLLEDVPGTGKTMLSKSLAASFDMEFGSKKLTPVTSDGNRSGVNWIRPNSISKEAGMYGGAPGNGGWRDDAAQ